MRLEPLEEQLLNALWSNDYDGQLITGDLYADRALVGAVAERVRETAGYSAYLENVLATQAHLLTLLVYQAEGFDRQNLIVSGAIYSDLQDVRPLLCYTGMAETLPGGRITDVILLLTVLLVALTLFSEERNHRTLLLPLKRGRGPLYLSKLAAGGIMLALGVVLLYGSNLLIGLLRCGMTPLSAPIQSIYGFQQSPWHITVGTYYLLFLLAKLIAAWCVFGVLTLACNTMRTPVGAAGMAALLLLCDARPEAAERPIQTACSALRLWDSERLFQTYYNLNLFGKPVPDGLFALVFWTCVCAFCIVCALLLWRFRSPITTERKLRFFLRRKKKPGTLFSYEARKLLVMERAGLVLLALLILQIWTYHSFSERLSPEAYLYLDYVSRLEGPPNEEKNALLAQRQANYDEVYSKLAELVEAMSSGRITPESYQIQAGFLQQEFYGEDLFRKVQAQYEEAKQKGGDFVSLLGWERLFGRRGAREWLELGAKLGLCLSLGLAACNAVESETSMEQLLAVSARKRHAQRYKRILAALYAAASCAICVIPHVLAVRSVYGLDGLTSPAASVSLLGIRFGTVRFALAIYFCAALAAAILAAGLILLISKKLKRTTPSIIASAAATSFPFVVCALLA
ncbi:MAG: hypothetical protein IJJ99_01440 [Oscillospiraceae bacterium]|nr:hypothetical protein [Oscillospiraceae bacterium]